MGTLDLVPSRRQACARHRREPRPGPSDGARAGGRRRRHRITGRTQETLDATAGEIRARGRQAWTFKADMACPTNAQQACERVARRDGPIDILINNVGNREVSMSIEAEPLETWQTAIDLNLTSCFLGTKIVGGAMRARGTRRPHHQHRLDQRADRQSRHRRARLRDRQGGRAAFHTLRGGRLGALRDHGQCHLSRPVHDRHQQGMEREASGRDRGVRQARSDGPPGRARRDRAAGRVSGQPRVAATSLAPRMSSTADTRSGRCYFTPFSGSHEPCSRRI